MKTNGKLHNAAIIILALVFAAFFALLGWGVWYSNNVPDREALPSTLIGRQAPQLNLPLLDNPQEIFQPKSNSPLLGAPFVLNVWASWCVECRVEQPTMLELAKSNRVTLIGYDLKDASDDAQQWLAQNGNPYGAIVIDTDGRAALDWGIYGAPETFLVDARGIVRWKHVGPLDDALVARELLPQLEALK